jgi:predicted transposase YdaD
MPNDFDKIFKENFEPLLPHLLRKLLGINIERTEDLKDKLQITLEREMDNLLKVKHDDPAQDYGLHWEVQSKDEDTRWRNGLYYGMFAHKYRMALKQIVLFIGEEKPKFILQNVLELEGFRLEFKVIVLRDVPKEVFLNSQTPEEVVLAILCDFGNDRPELVIRQILNNLLKLTGRVPRLKKYQQQLAMLSRLRRLDSITKTEIQAMPIHFEIEKDAFYLEGLEKGEKKGIEQHRYESVVKMLQLGELTHEKIALIAGVNIAYVQGVENELKFPKKP